MASVAVQLDSKSEVSSLVIKAYVVSLLLLLTVLVWSVGDAWVEYAQGVFMPAYTTHFSLYSSRSATAAQRRKESLREDSSWRLRKEGQSHFKAQHVPGTESAGDDSRLLP